MHRGLGRGPHPVKLIGYTVRVLADDGRVMHVKGTFATVRNRLCVA